MSTAIVDNPSTHLQPASELHLELEGRITPRNESSLIVASPYTALPHLLDLTTLSLPFSLLARALTYMEPTTPAYATTPYHKAFNWPSVMTQLRTYIESEYPSSTYTFPETSYYVIVFRSQVLVKTDRVHLGLLDEEAHKEAVESGGLLKYWFGTPDADSRNLATCLWRSREDAKRGGAGKVS